MGCTDCLGRTPFGSLIATILCCLGVGLFCGTLYEAIDITARRIMEGLFKFRIPWLETIMIVFIVIACVMGCFAILLLIFGFLATGATRQNIYSGVKCIMGGRVSAAFFVILTYIINLCWMVTTSSLTIPIFMFAMLRSICSVEIESQEEWIYDNYCLNLSRFGIYRNYTENVDQNALCTASELSQFCRYVRDAGPMYSLAFIGSLLIVLALVYQLSPQTPCSFLCCLAPCMDSWLYLKGAFYDSASCPLFSTPELQGTDPVQRGHCPGRSVLHFIKEKCGFLVILSANYHRIKVSKELSEYRDAVDLDLEIQDDQVFANPKTTTSTGIALDTWA